MNALPTGTVSLLFSDVEGSTLLLGRLGPEYAKAVDGQRLVQRAAWAAHGGTELGTEGDSFYVVFPTAEGAVKAATRAQRDLAGFAWPGGERVRVRMGIHTGSPTPHDGAYVGMDVHRAARIAGAAHGEQVLVSQATAGLVSECLPEGVTVKDLGSHQLKDIPSPEHLFQLVIAGLQVDFPPVKTLGASSSLPRPATPLVGRDGELAELTALLRSPEVRLATLTGPGGSGKTRLAIGVAERLVERFPDGVYFVALASATTADVMWTSIAEVLDVPPEGRIPPGFFDHVAHRTALFVLDNLEQIDGVDGVVAQLLEHGPQVVVIATSRRPLNVSGERQHAVPPLELPTRFTLEEAERSGAVQMFVHHAKAVKGNFALTASNAGEVSEVCRRLDGLPLAIELAAARTKLLTPAALLVRLDKSLDIASANSMVAARQKTLRDTIAWSYQLLVPAQQALLRSLGVFAGGADLDAVTVVCAGVLGDSEPLDLIADLVDASLVTISEDQAGEPRIGMLETIRAYARDMLLHSGEHETSHQSHAKHYLSVAEAIRPWFEGGGLGQLVGGRSRFEAEHDNFREALSWALNDLNASGHNSIRLGLRLAASLGPVWVALGNYGEGRRWLEKGLTSAAELDLSERAECLTWCAYLARVQGDYGSAMARAEQAVELSRRLGDQKRLCNALTAMGVPAVTLGHVPVARKVLEEAVSIASAIDEDRELALALAMLGWVEAADGQLERALELETAAAEAAERQGDIYGLILSRHNAACSLQQLGRAHEAQKLMSKQFPLVVQLSNPELLVSVAEDYAAVLCDLAEYEAAARLIGAADDMRARNEAPRAPTQADQIEEPLANARAALRPTIWDKEYNIGRNMTVEDALTEALAATANMTA